MLPVIRAAKLAVDGALEARTAALLEPYVDGDLGSTMMDPGVFAATILALDRSSIQEHVHWIGDRAARTARDAAGRASRKWEARIVSGTVDECSFPVGSPII